MEARFVNILINIAQAGVTPHDGSCAVLEVKFRDLFESVSVELRVVCLPEADGVLGAACDGVLIKPVVLLSPGIHHRRGISPFVRVNAEPETGRSGHHDS